MRRRANRFIDLRDAAYLDLLIGDRDPETKKIGLQRLCKLYRQGLRHRDEERITTHLMGLLFDDAPKVKRWALNALALAGSRKNVAAIAEAIRRDRDDPDILGAGISALCALLPEEKARAELAKIDLPIEGGVLLAAVQHSGHFQGELRTTRLNIDTALAADLRLANILVGLNKAPGNLFSLSHANSEVIGELNFHPDVIVAQYSVWATYEHPSLGLKNLRLPLHDVETRPANVRKYVYQLAAKDVGTAQDNFEFLMMGSQDESIEARAGLATGLATIYFDSLETLILDWYDDEESDLVKQRLLEHMARYAERCPSYRSPVLKAYEASDMNSLTRARLESAARDTELYTEMKKIIYNAEGRDLFGLALANTSSAPRVPNATERAKEVVILIVTALPKEAAAVRATFDADEPFGIKNDANSYRLGAYGAGDDRRQVVLAEAGVGKSNAATVTANALRSLPNIKYIIMVGIAGGCPNSAKPDEHIRLGDIVYSSNAGIIEYDYIKETSSGRETRSSLQRPAAALLQIANDLMAGELLSARPWETIISAGTVRLGERFERPNDDRDILRHDGSLVDHPRDINRRKGAPRVHPGAIGTADTLLKSSVKRDDLRDRYGIRAIEMEASGLQTAAWAQGKDVFVVRGICDYCDEHKNDDWQNYAALAAAAFTRALVEATAQEWLAVR